MSSLSGGARSDDDAKHQEQRVFRRIFRRMMLLMTVTLLVAAVGAGIAGKELGIVVVLFCLWVLLMIVAAVSERWFMRHLHGD